jgi:hypothetical protein
MSRKQRISQHAMPARPSFDLGGREVATGGHLHLLAPIHTSPLQKIPLYSAGRLAAEYFYIAFLSHNPLC